MWVIKVWHLPHVQGVIFIISYNLQDLSGKAVGEHEFVSQPQNISIMNMWSCFFVWIFGNKCCESFHSIYHIGFRIPNNNHDNYILSPDQIHHIVQQRFSWLIISISLLSRQQQSQVGENVWAIHPYSEHQK